MSRFWRPNASVQAHALLLKWLYFGSQITLFYNYWPQKSFCLTKFLLNPNLRNINGIGVSHCLVQKLEDASPRAFRHLFTFLFKTAGRHGIYRSVTSWIETFLVKTSHLPIKIATFEFQNHAPISHFQIRAS
jgi:hypothetical protein